MLSQLSTTLVQHSHLDLLRPETPGVPMKTMKKISIRRAGDIRLTTAPCTPTPYNVFV